MSIEKAAEFARMHGRGNDSMLIHMSPKEVNALQTMAKQHGGSLTINPQTGLPEAGFLDAILPAVAGAGLAMIPGVGPLMAAGIVGGGTALLSKDLNKGLMAGLGAFGGASLAAGLAGAGAAAGSTAAASEAAAAASSLYTPAEIASMQAAGMTPAQIATSAADYVGGASGIGTANMPFSQATQNALANPVSTGMSEIAKAPGEFFKKNMFPIAAVAAPALLGGSSSLFGGSKPSEDSEATGYVRPYTYSQTRNPNYTGAGTPYFTQTMTPGTPVAASDWGTRTVADGGIVGLADGGIAGYTPLQLGGPQDYRMAELIPVQANTYAPNIRPVAPEVAAYNQKLMQQANQQYNINPTLAPMQVPGMEKPSTDTDWLDQQYQKALGRNAEIGGRKNWEAALAAGQSKEDIFNKGILGSSEYQQQQANLAAGRKAYINANGSHMYQDLVDAGQFDPSRAPTAKTASTNAGTGTSGGVQYDPKTGRYSGSATLPSSPAQKTEVEKMREELDALKASQNVNNDAVGAANGGLMRYAMGGDIGGRYPSTDDGGVFNRGDMVGAHSTINMAPHYPMQGMYQGYADGGGITNTKMAAVQQYSALAASSADGMKQVMAKAKAGDYNAMTALNNLNQTPNQNYAQGGGIYNLGSYSDGGRLLKGPGDGVSDDIPAQIGARQPARLADGEFVVPARIVSELGNGSTDAGAKRLYAMMDRVQQGRKKSVGKDKVAVDSKAYKHLPA